MASLTPETVYNDVQLEDPFAVPIPKRVLIVGAGPAGLVSLRNLLERGKFDTVQVVERRADIGGVWNLEPDAAAATSSTKPRWPSPAYKGLIGNVLPEFLSFSGRPFPPPPTAEEGQPFPTLTETFTYLKSFAEPYLQSGLIRLNTEVASVEEKPWGEGWRVVLRDWSDEGNGKEIEEIWDAVIVAVHWHDNPEWPDTPGLDQLRNLGLAKHAKEWRGPQGNENKLAAVAQTPVYQSVRRPPWPGFPSLPDSRIKTVSSVLKYTVHLVEETDSGENDVQKTPKITADLKDGSIIEDLDNVYVGTGYYAFPDFVKVFHRPQLHSEPGYAYTSTSPDAGPPQASSDDQDRRHVPVVTSQTRPRRIPHLHRLSIYGPNPSLAFVGSVMTYTPFLTADIVSTYVALVFDHRIPIPSSTWDRLAYERNRLEAIRLRLVGMDDPTSFLTYSVMSVDEEAYGRGLREDVVKVLPELDSSLPVWSEETSKAKENMFKTKLEALKWAQDRGGGGNLESSVNVQV
ncbi:hypothetical protein EST38_g6793 [Candolleomyces aberdarensis]|uniref:FAD/NAD(P)-binding domain-containing protein n=1 Tax=Candolleomyces aberdarensis TaxID=2316362 RepID=A0A4Q2DH00_9AGAR|nr:hypothetical protein EST38_g6793 [Candolleomyces aberdarensis]